MGVSDSPGRSWAGFTATRGSIYQEERPWQQTQRELLMAEEVQAGTWSRNRRVQKSIIKMHGE